MAGCSPACLPACPLPALLADQLCVCMCVSAGDRGIHLQGARGVPTRCRARRAALLFGGLSPRPGPSLPLLDGPLCGHPAARHGPDPGGQGREPGERERARSAGSGGGRAVAVGRGDVASPTRAAPHPHPTPHPFHHPTHTRSPRPGGWVRWSCLSACACWWTLPPLCSSSMCARACLSATSCWRQCSCARWC